MLTGPTTFIPDVPQVTYLLAANFPERVKRLIIGPVPYLCLGIFWAIRPAIPVETRKKVVLMAGEDDKENAPPPAKLEEIMGAEAVRALVTVKIKKTSQHRRSTDHAGS